MEDDDALREVLAEVLTDEGYSVDCAANGREALEHLNRTGPSPDLILLDLVMPIMDGWAFRDTQRRIQRLAKIPTVILSASYPPDSPRMRNLGAQAVLSKPVSMEQLIRALRRVAPTRSLHAAH